MALMASQGQFFRVFINPTSTGNKITFVGKKIIFWGIIRQHSRVFYGSHRRPGLHRTARRSRQEQPYCEQINWLLCMIYNYLKINKT